MEKSDLKPHLVDVVSQDPELDDSKWVLKSKVSLVEDIEEGAEYHERPADLYVSVSDNSRACLYFGGDEYEGLGNHVYRLTSDGTLFDDDGDEIKYTIIDIRNPNPNPNTHTVITTTNTNLNTNIISTNFHATNTNKLSDPCREELIERGECYLSDGEDNNDCILNCDNF